MIVLDASAVVEWLLRTPAGQRIHQRVMSHPKSLHAPQLLDVEVLHVLRRLVHRGAVLPDRAELAVQDLLDIRITRHPLFGFVPRIWQLRNNLSAYDAAYVALAEGLGATLLTRDARLASAPVHAAAIELF